MVISFLIGLFVGSLAGVMVTALCAANGRGRDEDEQNW